MQFTLFDDKVEITPRRLLSTGCIRWCCHSLFPCATPWCLTCLRRKCASIQMCSPHFAPPLNRTSFSTAHSTNHCVLSHISPGIAPVNAAQLCIN